jgi:hypothetical protein
MIDCAAGRSCGALNAFATSMSRIMAAVAAAAGMTAPDAHAPLEAQGDSIVAGIARRLRKPRMD